MHELLSRSLKEEGDADGDEYNRSLDAQGEVDMYLQAYASLLADRRATLVAERTILAAHDGKERKLRKTKAAKAAAAAAIHNTLLNPETSEDFELQPEHEVLFKELTSARKAISEDTDERAIKSVMYVAVFAAEYRVRLTSRHRQFGSERNSCKYPKGRRSRENHRKGSHIRSTSISKRSRYISCILTSDSLMDESI